MKRIFLTVKSLDEWGEHQGAERQKRRAGPELLNQGTSASLQERLSRLEAKVDDSPTDKPFAVASFVTTTLILLQDSHSDSRPLFSHPYHNGAASNREKQKKVDSPHSTHTLSQRTV
jgi:hypothetical protein